MVRVSTQVVLIVVSNLSIGAVEK